MRFLLYSHDGMGLGHVRRQLAIASALTALDPQALVLVATSIDEVASLGLPRNVDTLKLPGLRKLANERYASRRLALRGPEIRSLRASLLRTAVGSFRPDVMLVDKHPLGAGGELRPALEAAKACGIRTVLGLRDILDDPAAVRKEWDAAGTREIMAHYYDHVLVYGERSVFDPVQAYEFPRPVAAQTRFCGYVVHESGGATQESLIEDEQTRRKDPVVLGTIGGGEDGFTVLRTFIQAAAGAPWKAIAVTGPLLDEQEYRFLEQLAAQTGVTLHRFVPGLSSLFRLFDALVCMGGYNTLAEALSTGTPTVCVPRVAPRSEQLLRSRAFERLGLLRTIHPDDLSTDEIRSQVARALDTSRLEILARASRSLTFHGTRQAATILLNLKESKLSSTRPVWMSAPQPALTR